VIVKNKLVDDPVGFEDSRVQGFELIRDLSAIKQCMDMNRCLRIQRIKSLAKVLSATFSYL